MSDLYVIALESYLKSITPNAVKTPTVTETIPPNRYRHLINFGLRIAKYNPTRMKDAESSIGFIFFPLEQNETGLGRGNSVGKGSPLWTQFTTRRVGKIQAGCHLTRNTSA